MKTVETDRAPRQLFWKEARRPTVEEVLSSEASLFHLHGYQPPRRFILDREMLFDISGETNGSTGWNEHIWQECQKPLLSRLSQAHIETHDPILSSPLVNSHLFGITRDWAKQHHPQDWALYREIIRHKNLPVVDSYFHIILPVQDSRISELLIGLGITCFEQDYGVKLSKRPFAFWPAELAVDTEIAALLKKHGTSVLLTGRHQLGVDTGSPIYRVNTRYGPLHILPYDNGFTQRLAFGDITWSEDYARAIRQFHEATGYPPFVAVDMETIGHQRGQNSLFFFNHLIGDALPSALSHDPPLNGQTKRTGIASASLYASSWSCPHPEFGRWTGKGGCDCDATGENLRRHKQALYEGIYNELQTTVSGLEKTTPEWDHRFISWFMTVRSPLAIGESVDTQNLAINTRTAFRKLLVGLVGMSSCGWFFGRTDYERQIPEHTLNWLQKQK